MIKIMTENSVTESLWHRGLVINFKLLEVSLPVLNFQGHLVDPLVQYPVSCQHSILFFSSWLFRILYTKWLAFPAHYSSMKTAGRVISLILVMPQNTRKLNDMPNITKAVKMAKRNWNSKPQNRLLLYSLFYIQWASQGVCSRILETVLPETCPSSCFKLVGIAFK